MEECEGTVATRTHPPPRTDKLSPKKERNLPKGETGGQWPAGIRTGSEPQFL